MECPSKGRKKMTDEGRHDCERREGEKERRREGEEEKLKKSLPSENIVMTRYGNEDMCKKNRDEHPTRVAGEKKEQKTDKTLIYQ